MTGFEQGFADTERAAALTIKSAADVTRAAKKLERYAKTGRINAMRQAQAELDEAMKVLRQEVANTAEAWPFLPNEEEAYLKERFSAELRQVAASQGLEIHERDEQLIAYPAIVRVAPDRRAVRIDRKQESAIRPTYLAAALRANQQKPARFNGRSFLEAVYKAYKILVGSQEPLRRLDAGRLPAVPLAKIYESLTLMPGSGRDYSRADFARDLYRLDTDGPKATRERAQLHFHSGRQSNIAFVAPGGRLITYHSIAFSEVDDG
jgi:hypothetical protein